MFNGSYLFGRVDLDIGHMGPRNLQIGPMIDFNPVDVKGVIVVY